MKEGERIVNGRIEAIVLPTKERCAKRIDGDRDIMIVETQRGGFEARSFSFPLDFYLRKEIITRKQWNAGVLLHEAWYNGCAASPYVQFRYRESNGGSQETGFVPPGAFATEYRNAMAAIRGVPERRVAYQVCCEGKVLKLCTDKDGKEYSTARTAQRIGMPLLVSALDDLDAHFHG